MTKIVAEFSNFAGKLCDIKFERKSLAKHWQSNKNILLKNS